MLKMTIDNEEVLSNNDISIKEEILSPSSTILNNVYPKSWELDKDYTSRFYYPKDYSKLNIQNFSIEPEEAGKTIQVNGSATLTDVDTSKESRVLRLLGQTSQNGTPTPDAPVPVNVVSGDNEIVVCGKNLFDKDNANVLDAYFAISAPTITSNVANKTLYIPCKPNTTYQVQIIEGTSTYTIGYTYELPKDSVSVYGISTSNILRNGIVYGTITTDSKAKYLVWRFIQTAQTTRTLQQALDSIQIEKGPTATTYEPYIGSSYPLYLGVENLLEPKMATTTQSGITCTNNGDGTFTLNGTATSSISFRLDQSTYSGSDNLKTYNGTYTLSCNEIENGLDLRVMQTSTWTSPLRMVNNNTPVTNTFNLNNCFIYINVASGKTLNNLIIKPQLEKGSQVNHTSTTPIELCKIGTYQDYIYKDNGSWYLHKEIGKVVLDGTESWQVGSSATNRSVFSNQTTFVDRKNTSSYSDFYCDNFSYLGNAQGEVLGYAMSFNSGQYARFIYVQVPLSVVAQGQIDDFKNWLSTHNTIVYYVLANSTNTEITDTTLLEQLESLSS